MFCPYLLQCDENVTCENAKKCENGCDMGNECERGPWHRDCILADRIVRRRAQTVRKTLEIIQLRNHRWLAKDSNNISCETVEWPFDFCKPVWLDELHSLKTASILYIPQITYLKSLFRRSF